MRGWREADELFKRRWREERRERTAPGWKAREEVKDESQSRRRNVKWFERKEREETKKDKMTTRSRATMLTRATTFQDAPFHPALFPLFNVLQMSLFVVLVHSAHYLSIYFFSMSNLWLAALPANNKPLFCFSMGNSENVNAICVRVNSWVMARSSLGGTTICIWLPTALVLLNGCCCCSAIHWNVCYHIQHVFLPVIVPDPPMEATPVKSILYQPSSVGSRQKV